MDKTFTERVIELCKEYKRNNPLSFYGEVAEILSGEMGCTISSEKIRRISRRYRELYNLDENFNPKVEGSEEFTIQINADKTTTSERKIFLEKDELLDENTLLEKHGFDKNKFVLVSAKNSKWTTNGVKECYSSRIAVKPRGEFVWTQETCDKIFEKLKFHEDSRNILNSSILQTYNSGKALVLPIVDLHYSMMASMDDNRDTYNCTIARNKFFYVINDILNRTHTRDFDKIYFTIGNDMLNCDNKLGTTTKGTPQKNCDDVEKAIVEVTDMLIRGIDMLKEVAPVQVIHVPANHDYMVSFGIANALRIYYSEDDRVDIDYAYRDRKYFRFGNTLMGFAHDLKVDKVNDIVNADVREYISDTTSTVYFLAHLHHEECKDVNGTDVRRLPTISSNSRWSYEKGYSAVHKCQCFIVDEEYGITDTLYTMI